MIQTETPTERAVISPLGESEAFLRFKDRLSRVARVNRPVLIIGERGTGKELAAAQIHYRSPRWESSLAALNCAALPPSLIESELFGYEPGAFTGARQRRAGRFEAADGGTLFLDEIGNIPMEVQTKILRVVEYMSFERVGGTSPITVDVRLLGATNADLPALAEAGRFQNDLLDRLSFEVLHLPPLRDREGDIPLLANHFAVRMAHELGRPGVPVFSAGAMRRMEAWPWPGNVRELKNVVERAVYRSDASLVEEVVFNPFEPDSGRSLSGPPVVKERIESPEPAAVPGPDLETPLSDQVAALEVRLLREALKKTRFNQKEAARELGLTYHQFRGLYRKHGGRGLLAEDAG